MAQLLEHIAEGIKVRRPLDVRVADAEQEALRRAILRLLNELRKAEARVALRNLLTDPQLDPLGRALAVEGLRGAQWLFLPVSLAPRLGTPLPDRSRPNGPKWSVSQITLW